MADEPINRILPRLASAEASEAWADFLREYSSLILQVARRFERDPDLVSDCYLFACQELCRDNFKRLRRFDPKGTARFSTWLRAVVWNLCLDWHRQEVGRLRPFASVSHLSLLDQEVFRQVFERGASEEEAFLYLRTQERGLTPEKIQQSVSRIQRQLTPRQQWLLSVRSGRRANTDAPCEDEDGPLDRLADPLPSPEELATTADLEGRLHELLQVLPAGDRLLLQMRYEQELTLDQVARLLNLGNAQQADRRIRELLERLRRGLGGEARKIGL